VIRRVISWRYRASILNISTNPDESIMGLGRIMRVTDVATATYSICIVAVATKIIFIPNCIYKKAVFTTPIWFTAAVMKTEVTRQAGQVAGLPGILSSIDLHFKHINLIFVALVD
jgi:hypothetical protein